MVTSVFLLLTFYGLSAWLWPVRMYVSGSNTEVMLLKNEFFDLSELKLNFWCIFGSGLSFEIRFLFETKHACQDIGWETP